MCGKHSPGPPWSALLRGPGTFLVLPISPPFLVTLYENQENLRTSDSYPAHSTERCHHCLRQPHLLFPALRKLSVIMLRSWTGSSQLWSLTRLEDWLTLHQTLRSFSFFKRRSTLSFLSKPNALGIGEHIPGSIWEGKEREFNFRCCFIRLKKKKRQFHELLAAILRNFMGPQKSSSWNYKV